ncbi:MAG: helix-turn-helix domain-containing protein [Flavobacteriaceae bacterium]
MQPPPSFDTWTSLFAFAVAMGFFLGISIIVGKSKKNIPIALLVLAFSLILFQYVLFWTGYQWQFPYLIMLPHVCYYTTGPLLYWYLLTLHKKEVSFNYALHFVPAFLVSITFLGSLINMLHIAKIKIPWPWFSNNPWLIAAHMAIYAGISLRLIFSGKTANKYQALRKRWSTVLTGLFTVFVLAYLSYYILVHFPFFNSQWDYMISITMSLSIYAIGYFVIKEPQVFDGEFFTELFLPDENQDLPFETSLMNELFQKLTHHMETQKPFIDNELRLVHLADQLGFSTHLLSKVINKKSGKNFNQFVNDYRLQEAKRLLLENPDFNIKTIYFDVGFNNKATFYNAFKKEFHCTPSQFRESTLSSS